MTIISHGSQDDDRRDETTDETFQNFENYFIFTICHKSSIMISLKSSPSQDMSAGELHLQDFLLLSGE